MNNTRPTIKLLLIILTTSVFLSLKAQESLFEFEKTPVNSGFKMDGYWVWCGSVIKIDSVYHMFASRWPKTGPFPEGYRMNSEIVRATAKTAIGPFKFEEVVIGQRDSIYWDSNMSHNPTIHKIGDEFVLFYIGSDFSTFQNKGQLLRRIGYAKSKSIYGPWYRSEKPIINTEANNPAILAEKGRIRMMFRDSKLRVIIAQAATYKGPYTIENENVWPSCPLEDFYLYKASNKYHLICEDNVGCVSGHERWGIHFISNNGITGWQKCTPLIVYNHDIELNNNQVFHCIRRERVQLIIENKEITHIITAVYDGNTSWSQPVRLKHPISVD